MRVRRKQLIFQAMENDNNGQFLSPSLIIS